MFGQYATNRENGFMNEPLDRKGVVGQYNGSQVMASHEHLNHFQGIKETLDASFKINDNDGKVVDIYWGGPEIEINRRGEPYPFPGTKITAGDVIVGGALVVAFMAGSALAGNLFNRTKK